MRNFFFILFVLNTISVLHSQTILKGSVVDALTNNPIQGVTVLVEGSKQTEKTDENGAFLFSENLPFGEQIIRVEKEGYQFKRYPIVIEENRIVDIERIPLDLLADDLANLFTITLTDDELNDDDSGVDNISGLLSSSKDVFERTAAFEFSSSFFRVRGLDSDNGLVLINGIEMNKMRNGRPQWSNWGGLNDVLRNQELSRGLTPSLYHFGGVLGTTNINVRASSYKKEGRVTYSSSNRSYTNRLMVNYTSGLLDNGWSYAFMAGKRWGNEGYQDATLYDSNSFFASIEKKINNNHSLNFTSIYAPNRRGKSSPTTQEVFDLKGIKYNEYWGWQDGQKRNARIKEIREPIFMLNHYWSIGNKSSLNTNIGYQLGESGSSRLDYAGGKNPSPVYYKNLPSYYLYNNDYSQAYTAEQNFINNGQIDWDRIYDANITNNKLGKSAAYVLYEDRNDDKQLTVNSIFTTEINDNIIVNSSINYKKLESENYGKLKDLLGSTVGYLDVDTFTKYSENAPNNTVTPNRYAFEYERFKYNYNVYANVLNGYLQGVFKYRKVDFYIAVSGGATNYQREGLYKNGRNQDNSFGKGDRLAFTNFGSKVGATYKISGKHLIDVNTGYMQRAPFIRNTYTNSRENHDYVGVIDGVKAPNIDEISEELVTSLDVSYIFRSPIVKSRLTGFYTTVKNSNETSFFFIQANNFLGFSQEVLVGANKLHVGAELGVEAQVLPTLKLKGAASIGQYTYSNNPYLYVTSSSDEAIEDNPDFGVAQIGGISYLKDYRVAAGPQKAYSIGFEYRDPSFWWFGATANFFDDIYLDISPITRTDNFYLDKDGIPYNDYKPEIARELLKQEKFDNYMVVNLVGGKSWRVNKKYIGFFASAGNLLNEKYKTGGFEQGRKADYRSLKDDASLSKRLFGPRYWYARGANYFLNIYYKF